MADNVMIYLRIEGEPILLPSDFLTPSEARASTARDLCSNCELVSAIGAGAAWLGSVNTGRSRSEWASASTGSLSLALDCLTARHAA